MTDERFAALDAQTTEELRQQAFETARGRGDLGFFLELVQHLPAAENAEGMDNSTGALGAGIDDVVGIVRELTGHGLGDAEPLLRARFIDYLLHHG